MKKFVSIIILLIGSQVFGLGQKYADFVHIQWGEELHEKKNNTLENIVGYDESGIFVLKRSKKTLYLEHFDHSLHQTNSIELMLEEKGRKRIYEGIIQLGGNLYLFSSFRNQKQKKNYLFYQSINKKTLLVDNNVEKIAEIDYKGNSQRNSGKFAHVLSRDSTHVMVYFDSPYEKYENEQFGFHVFDENMNQVWEKFVDMPYKEDLFGVERFRVDENGNAYLLGMLYKDKKKKKRQGKPNYSYRVLAYFDQGNTLVEYPISLPGKFITDMQITITRQGDIICGGFYSEEGTFSIIGSYFLTVNKDTKEIETSSTKEFGIDFITQNLTKRKENKAKKKAEKGKDVELFEYNLREIVQRSDGGAVLVGEQFYVNIVTTTMTNSNGGTSTKTTYYYNYHDIIVININPDGTIEWTEKIAKKQTTTNDGGFYSSYALAVVDDDLYFVFNDNPKNLFYKGSGKLYNFKKGPDALTIVVKVDPTGAQTRKALFAAGYKDVLTRPKVCEQTTKREMIIFGERKKNQQFARLGFTD